MKDKTTTELIKIMSAAREELKTRRYKVTNKEHIEIEILERMGFTNYEQSSFLGDNILYFFNDPQNNNAKCSLRFHKRANGRNKGQTYMMVRYEDEKSADRMILAGNEIHEKTLRNLHSNIDEYIFEEIKNEDVEWK